MPLSLVRALLSSLHPACLIAGLLLALGTPRAEPVVDAPAESGPAAAMPPAIGEAALEDWLGDEVISSRLRHLIDRAHAEGARQPYHRRQPSWIQSVADLQAHDARQQAEDAARAERDRQTVAWLLEDEARRTAASAAEALAAEPAPDEDALRPWRRALGVVALFGGLVALGVTWLVRRPRRHRRPVTAGTPAPTDGGAGSSRRRRTSRTTATSTPTSAPPPRSHRHGHRDGARP